MSSVSLLLFFLSRFSLVRTLSKNLFSIIFRSQFLSDSFCSLLFHSFFPAVLLILKFLSPRNFSIVVSRCYYLSTISLPNMDLCSGHLTHYTVIARVIVQRPVLWRISRRSVCCSARAGQVTWPAPRARRSLKHRPRDRRLRGCILLDASYYW